jgi:hypothetical protein
LCFNNFLRLNFHNQCDKSSSSRARKDVALKTPMNYWITTSGLTTQTKFLQSCTPIQKNFVAAFQKQINPNCQSSGQNSGLLQNNPNNHYNSNCRPNNQGNNSNKNEVICVYCKILGHDQQDCQQRIQDNHGPCLEVNLKAFWPKINSNRNTSNSNDNNDVVNTVFL